MDNHTDMTINIAWIKRGLLLLLFGSLLWALNDQMNQRIAAEQEILRQERIIEVLFARDSLHRVRHTENLHLTSTYGIPLPYLELLREHTVRYDLDLEFMVALMRVESNYRPFAVSHKGAIGLMQIMPTTARWLDSTITRRDLFKPSVNIAFGCRYFRYLLDEFDQDYQLAATAYNLGPGRLTQLIAADYAFQYHFYYRVVNASYTVRFAVG